MKNKHTRLLFDNCSQKSYIIEELRKELGLQVTRRDKILIKTFGNTEPQLKTADVVQLAIYFVDQLIIFIELYVIEVVCSPLANQRVNIAVDKYPHLQGLPLAETCTGGESLEISVLIGSDYYWSIVENGIIREECGPTALSTKLRFVPSGRVDIGNDTEISLNLNLTEHVMKTETFVMQEDVDLRNQLELFWDIDTLGVNLMNPLKFTLTSRTALCSTELDIK